VILSHAPPCSCKSKKKEKEKKRKINNDLDILPSHNTRIFLAAVIELVMTVMLWILSISIAGMRPVRMAMSSTSIDVTFKKWTYSCLITELSAQMCTAAIAT